MINNRKELIQQACVMYYEMGYSQNRIAEILNISRSYVSQLLMLGRETGIVQIHIKSDDMSLRMIKTEVAFRKIFPKIKKVFIMKSESTEFSDVNLPKFAAPYITDMILEAKVIGINLGYTVENTIKNLKSDDFKDCEDKKVVQIMGGFSTNQFGSGTPNNIVLRLANVLRCSSYYLNCPAIIELPELLNSFKEEKTIKSVIDIWDVIDLAIMGIGTVDSNSRMYNAFDEQTKKAISEMNIKAEATLNFFDSEGKYIPLLLDRKISIDFESLKKINTKAFICKGVHKSQAIVSLLNADMIDILITDSITAETIMQDFMN